MSMDREHMDGPCSDEAFEREVTRRSVLRGALVGAAAVPLSGLLEVSGASASDASKKGRRGGILRVGVAGTGSAETLGPINTGSNADVARAFQCFEGLAKLGSGKHLVELQLAEEISPNHNGTVWTVRLRKDVRWHDGKPLTADDVIYTILYDLKVKNYAGNGLWSQIDSNHLKKVDRHTLRIPLPSPNFLFPQLLAEEHGVILQRGTTSFLHPIGTGPFKFKSFTVGQQATYVRNPHYWGGPPKLDGVQILSINSPTAQVNGLLTGQLDAITGVPFTSISQLKAGGAKVSIHNSGAWYSVVLYCGGPPFNNPQVRQAMKLLMDRHQVVREVYGGYAKVGNDLVGWFDPDYASHIPQRPYDPELAKSLLSRAGVSNLTVPLPVVEGTPVANWATLFAASAAAGGVKINVQPQTAAQFYSGITAATNSGMRPDQYSAETIMAQMATTMSQHGYNEPKWYDNDFFRAYNAAIRSRDPAKQKDHLVDAQRIMHERGGYLIAVFPDFISATSSRVSGTHWNVQQPFGLWNFRDVTLA